MEVRTSMDDGVLEIVYNNPTRFPLKNAEIKFKTEKETALTYRVMDVKGEIISEGYILDSRRLHVTLFPSR